MSNLDTFRHGDDDRIRTFQAGETVYSQGDAADCMYVVVEGEAEIFIGSHLLEIVKPPSFFGEMALISHKTRSAGVRARTDLKIERVDEKRFEFLVRNTPFFALEVMKVMAERLRRMDEPLNAA